MRNPIKIIHKFKNNNRRIQYKVYIFLGSQVDDNVMKLLKRIEDKDLLTSFTILSDKEIKQLEKYYGEKWYEHFFTSYHINYQINNIKNNSSKRKSLESKLGKDWVNKFLNEPVVKKVSYSYAASYYNYLLMKNKIKTLTRKNEMDFRTYQSEKSMELSQDTSTQAIDPSLLEQEGGVIKLNLDKQFGGQDLDDDLDMVSDYDDILGETDMDEMNKPISDDNIPTDFEEEKEETEEKVISEDELDEEVEGDFDLEELTKLYV